MKLRREENLIICAPLIHAQAAEPAQKARTEILSLFRHHVHKRAVFALALVRLAGNTLVEAVMTGLRGAIESYVAAGTERLEDWPRTAVRLRAEHRAILDAVANGDAAGAVVAVREHIEGFYREAGL